MTVDFHQNERNVNEKFKFSDGGLRHPYVKTKDIGQASTKSDIKGEPISFSAGAAGTTGTVALNQAPITDSTKAVIGDSTSSSFSWATGSILTTEVAWDYELNDTDQLADLSNGEFALDYLTGKIRYSKATTGTTDTCNYSVRETTLLNVFPVSAFGEVSVIEPTPIVHLQFPYNINPTIVQTQENSSGSTSVLNNKAQVSTGAAANSSARLQSKIPIKYQPGQGGLARFTAVFTTGVTGSTQYIGVGDIGDGFFVGFNGATFGLMRRQGGSPEIRTLTVTTGSSDAENITITLDGDVKNDVAVTNTGDVTSTANEIAAADYSDVGTGWEATVVGDKVVFVSYDAAAHTGGYSLSSATSAIGTFAQTVVGVAPTETIVAQSSWNVDPLDGTGPSQMVLDQTKGNVYQIKYQWLGYGMIFFAIENPQTGNFQDFHHIVYANANLNPSVDNPTMPLYIESINTSNTSDIVVQTPSMGGFIEGRKNGLNITHGKTTTANTFTASAQTPVLTIRNKKVYQGVINKVRTRVSFAGLSQDSTKTSNVIFTLNSTLTGASFSDVSSNTSTVESDDSATSISGGQLAFAQGISRTDKTVFTLSEDVVLNPGDSLTISIIPNAANPDVTAAFNWVDDF